MISLALIGLALMEAGAPAGARVIASRVVKTGCEIKVVEVSWCGPQPADHGCARLYKWPPEPVGTDRRMERGSSGPSP